MTNRYLATSWLLLLGTALSSCGGIPCGNSHPYTGSAAHGPLKAPAGITVPAPDPAYVIPGEGKTAPGDADKIGACMIVPPNVLPAPTTKAAPAAATAAPAQASPVVKPQPAPAAASSTSPPVAAGGPMG